MKSHHDASPKIIPKASFYSLRQYFKPNVNPWDFGYMFKLFTSEHSRGKIHNTERKERKNILEREKCSFDVKDAISVKL